MNPFANYNKKLYEVGTIVSSIVQIVKLREREVQRLFQGHITNKRWSQGVDVGILVQAHIGTPRLHCPVKDSSSLPMVPQEDLKEESIGGYLIKLRPRSVLCWVVGSPVCFSQWEPILPYARPFHKGYWFWGFWEGSFKTEGWFSSKLLLSPPPF